MSATALPGFELSGFELLRFVLTATPSPAPAFEGDPNLITPGVIGFAITFVIAVATVLLLLDMNRRVRRVRYREEARQRIAAETEIENADDVATKPPTEPAD